MTGAGVARGHQLCLPADPNTLGFFATEGLKVHPTRSPRPNSNTNKQEQNRNTTKENNKKEAKQLRVSWARTTRGLSALEFWGREGVRMWAGTEATRWALPDQ